LQDQVVSIEGFLLDITENRKNEAKLSKYRLHLEHLVERRTVELRRSTQRFFKIIEFLPDATYVIDNKDKVIAWNLAMEKMTGISKVEVLGKAFKPFLTKFYLSDAPTLIEKVKEPQDIPRMHPSDTSTDTLCSEQILHGANGRADRCLSITAAKIFGDKGEYFGAIESIRDVTNLKAAERKAIENERMLSMLMNNLPGMAYRQKYDENRSFEFVSKGCKKLTGYEVHEILNSTKTTKDVIHPEDFDRVYNQIKDALKSKRSFQVEYRIFTASGDVKWVFDKGEGIYSEKNELIAIEGFVSDFSVYKEIEEKLRNENLLLRASMKDRFKFHDIIGQCNAMQDVYDLIIKAAMTDENVFIFGESGTGKELVARAIHHSSNRKDKKFFAVNCGAIPESLIESEFFGVKKGAFTGAVTDKKGYLDHADGGTLFLDEISEISVSIQVKLLRAIEGGGFSPVGSTEVKKPDLRILTASNKNLVDLMKQGQIREDFYFRIHVLPIHLPPLRDRGDDILLLVDHFLKLFGNSEGLATLGRDGLETLRNYNWPGNIRELQNVLRRYTILKNLDFMQSQNKKKLHNTGTQAITDSEREQKLTETIQQFEKQLIQDTLSRNHWQKIKSAKDLGISRKTLFRKMKTHGIIV
jgi:PAS domain S-box-containing protein